MIEDFLDELADGVAGLLAQVLGDLGLLQAGLVDEFGEGFDASGRREREKQPDGIRELAAALPVRIDADGDLGIDSRRVRNDEAQFESVGQNPKALTRGEQHALRYAGMAETVGEAAPGRGIQIGIQVHTPDPKPGRAILSDEQSAAVLVAFARLDGLDRFEAGVAELGEERLDDVVLDAQATAVGNEIPKLATHELPMFVQGTGLRAAGLGQQREAVEFRLQIELHERLRKGRAGERAIGCKVERH